MISTHLKAFLMFTFLFLASNSMKEPPRSTCAESLHYLRSSSILSSISREISPLASFLNPSSQNSPQQPNLNNLFDVNPQQFKVSLLDFAKTQQGTRFGIFKISDQIQGTTRYFGVLFSHNSENPNDMNVQKFLSTENLWDIYLFFQTPARNQPFSNECVFDFKIQENKSENQNENQINQTDNEIRNIEIQQSKNEDVGQTKKQEILENKSDEELIKLLQDMLPSTKDSNINNSDSINSPASNNQSNWVLPEVVNEVNQIESKSDKTTKVKVTKTKIKIPEKKKEKKKKRKKKIIRKPKKKLSLTKNQQNIGPKSFKPRNPNIQTSISNLNFTKPVKTQIEQSETYKPQKPIFNDININVTKITKEINIPVTKTPIIENIKDDTPIIEHIIEDIPIIEHIIENTPNIEPIIEDTPIIEHIIEDTPIIEKINENTPIVETIIEDTPIIEHIIEDIPNIEPIIEDTPKPDNIIEDTPKTNNNFNANDIDLNALLDQIKLLIDLQKKDNDTPNDLPINESIIVNDPSPSLINNQINPPNNQNFVIDNQIENQIRPNTDNSEPNSSFPQNSTGVFHNPNNNQNNDLPPVQNRPEPVSQRIQPIPDLQVNQNNNFSEFTPRKESVIKNLSLVSINQHKSNFNNNPINRVKIINPSIKIPNPVKPRKPRKIVSVQVTRESKTTHFQNDKTENNVPAPNLDFEVPQSNDDPEFNFDFDGDSKKPKFKPADTILHIGNVKTKIPSGPSNIVVNLSVNNVHHHTKPIQPVSPNSSQPISPISPISNFEPSRNNIFGNDPNVVRPNNFDNTVQRPNNTLKTNQQIEFEVRSQLEEARRKIRLKNEQTRRKKKEKDDAKKRKFKDFLSGLESEREETIEGKSIQYKDNKTNKDPEINFRPNKMIDPSLHNSDINVSGFVTRIENSGGGNRSNPNRGIDHDSGPNLPKSGSLFSVSTLIGKTQFNSGNSNDNRDIFIQPSDIRSGRHFLF